MSGPFLRFFALLFCLFLLTVWSFGQAPATSTTQEPQKRDEPSGQPPPSPPAPAGAKGTSDTPQTKRSTDYSQGAILLVVLILALLGALFWLLLSWSHRQEQTTYLGRVYRESVLDFEYKRLAGVPTERLQKGEYHEEVSRDVEWLKRFGMPEGASSLFSRTRPPGLGDPTGDGWDEKLTSEEQEQRRQSRQKMYEWQSAVEAEAMLRYRRDLDKARKEAETQAELAADVDLSAMRGRGAEFVLEFTAVVVIIFAAVVLGVLGILGEEQIGTLLAAIAGYVLGRATTRGRTSPDTRPAAEHEKEKEKKKELQQVQ